MKENRPSETAFTVLKSLVITANRPAAREIVVPETLDFAEQVLRYFGRNRFLRLAQKAWFRRLGDEIEKRTIPGLFLHHALRKLAVESFARREMDRGSDQFIMLGAGFDSLFYRLGKDAPNVRFLELDHPATHFAKRRFLESYDQTFPKNCDFGQLELGQSNGLNQCRVDPERNTLVIVEGVLMYLPETQVKTLLRVLSETFKNRFRILFSFLDQTGTRPEFHRQTRLANWWLRRYGEPFLWGTPPEKIESILEPANLVLEKLTTTREFARESFSFLEPTLPVANGEFLCLASTSI